MVVVVVLCQIRALPQDAENDVRETQRAKRRENVLTQLFQSALHLAQDTHTSLPQGDVLVQFKSDGTGSRLAFLLQLLLGITE